MYPPPLLGSCSWAHPLLSSDQAFSTGYIVTQVPAAPLIQRYGSKSALAVGHAGTAAAFLAVPLLRSPTGVAVLLAVMGVLQGPLAVAWTSNSAEWIPRGTHEQAWVQRFSGLSHVLVRCTPFRLRALLSLW